MSGETADTSAENGNGQAQDAPGEAQKGSQTQNASPGAQQPDNTDASSAATVKPDSQASTTSDHMIPKSRFDEVNNKLKQIETEREAEKKQAEEARKKAERDQAQKDGDLQKQIDLLMADLESERTKASEAEQKAKQAEIASIRATVAAKHNLPAEFVNRLVGETEEEIQTDVKKLLKAMPTPPPPATQTDGSAGRNASTPTPTMTDEEIREMAVRYGVSPEHLKTVMQSQT